MTKWHVPTPSTTDERGSEVHPAFGSIRVNRITSTPGSVLFDSDIPHGHFVRLTIGRMTRGRGLHRDWLNETGSPLVEVDMSEAQWGAFVSSFGRGSGVPCTIRSTESEQNVPGLIPESRLAISAEETRQAAEEALADVQTAFDALDSLDPKAGIKARREAMHRLRVALSNAPRNIEFAAQSLTEHTEKVVTKARADVEAMVVRHAERIGLDPSDTLTALTGSVPAPRAIEEEESC